MDVLPRPSPVDAHGLREVSVMPDPLPRRDMDFVGYARNVAQQVTDFPDLYHVSAGQAAAYSDLVGQFAAALQATMEPGSDTTLARSLKRTMRKSVEIQTRQILNQIRPSPTIGRVDKLGNPPA